VGVQVDLQCKFARMVAKLIFKALELGLQVTLGEAWRPDWVAKQYAARGEGVYPSYHTSRLAIDINLFRDGVLLTASEDYRPLGEWWETIGGTWGGRFRHPDGDHFSLGEE